MSFPVQGVAVGVFLLATAALAGAVEKDGPFILNDLAAAKAEAKKTGKPIFIVFRCER